MGVTSKVGAKARGADEVPDRCGGALRVGEEYDAGHGLESEGVVVDIYGREDCGVVLICGSPFSGRLHRV